MNATAPGAHRFFDYGLTFVPPLAVAPRTTAVVVTDMQLSNTSPDHGVNLALDRIEAGSARHLNDRVRATTLPALQRLLPEARARGITVVYLTLGARRRDLSDMTPRCRAFVRALERAGDVPDILWTGDPGFAICPEIRPEPDDIVVNKTGWGAFNSSPLDQVLIDRGIETLLMTGVTTNCCVETTARDAADRGYGVAIVDECTADFDAEAHDAALRAFHFNFGRVIATASDAIALLDGAGSRDTGPSPESGSAGRHP